jgi:hypothetical protein
MRLAGLFLITLSVLAAAAAIIAASQLPMRLGGLQGIDVSESQQTIYWEKLKSQGVAFAYIKATEGTSTSESSRTKHDGVFPPVAELVTPMSSGKRVRTNPC